MGNENYTLFWKTNEKYGCFSNWYKASFIIGDFEYQWVEQYMMSQKAVLFGDVVSNTKILKAKTPKECKKYGRDVIPFDPKVWDDKKETIVYEGVKAKFEQNPNLLKKLKETGDSIIAEASPLDDIWGIGLKAKDAKNVAEEEWPGQNLLGRTLMQVRDDLEDVMSQDEIEKRIKEECVKESDEDIENKKVNKELAKKIASLFQDYKQKAADMLKNSAEIEPFLLRVDEKFKTIPKVGEKLAYIPELILMVRSYVLKEYTDIALAEIIGIVAALIYFVSPLDIIPDGIPGIGFLDDALVAGIIVSWCEDDIKKYMDWVKNK